MPKVGNAIENISLSRTSNKMSTSFGDLDISDIVEYVNNDGKKSYTFKVFNSSQLQSNIDFENLHLVELPQGGYLAYILRWQPNEQWYINNDYMFNLATFTGRVERFDLDYNALSSSEYVDGANVVASKDVNSTNSRDWELDCSDYSWCSCSGIPSYCACSQCPWVHFVGCASTSGGGVGTGDSGSGTTVGSGGTSNSNNVPNGDSSVVVEAPTLLEIETEQFFDDLTEEELECVSAFNDSGSFRYQIKKYFEDNPNTTMTMSGGDNTISAIPQEVIDFANQSVDAYCAGGEVDFDDEVILDDSLNDTQIKCVHEKLSNSNIFYKNMLNKFNYSHFTYLLFDKGPTSNGDWGITKGMSLSYDLYKITISDNIENTSNLAKMVTLSHELVHAYMFKSLKDFGLLTFDSNNDPIATINCASGVNYSNINLNDLSEKDRWVALICSFVENNPGNQQWTHELFNLATWSTSTYRETLEQLLLSENNWNNESPIFIMTMQSEFGVNWKNKVSEYMSWRGLEGTNEFQVWAQNEGVQQVFDTNGNLINDPFNAIISTIASLGNNECE